MKLIRAWHLAVGETEAWRGYAPTLGSCCRAEIFILNLLGHFASILKIVEGGERWSGWGFFLFGLGFFVFGDPRPVPRSRAAAQLCLQGGDGRAARAWMGSVVEVQQPWAARRVLGHLLPGPELSLAAWPPSLLSPDLQNQFSCLTSPLLAEHNHPWAVTQQELFHR